MLFLDNSTSKKFLVGVWLGFAFSIAVILSTIGIMDGFEHALRSGLRTSSGDIQMQSRHGFFKLTDDLKGQLKKLKMTDYASVVQTESFLIHQDESRGVLVKAIEDHYGDLVGLPLQLVPQSVAIGSEIARINNIKVGDKVVLAFGKGDAVFNNMPALISFNVQKIVSHRVYQKDLRIVYARLTDIQNVLSLGEKINLVSLNVTNRDKPLSKSEKGNLAELSTINNKINELNVELNSDFYFKPYWREFSYLIEAAQVEKVLITVILQIIVLISVFNVLAFIYFINEKKAKDLFLFKALGMSKSAIGKMWMALVLVLWVCSCLMAALFVEIFRLMLKHLSFLQLPSEIYHMPRIDLVISIQDYGLVFFLALVWILAVTFYLIRNLKNKSLLEGLRQEFS
jgi:ABC-type lipoprotein release transport system permease subunit